MAMPVFEEKKKIGTGAFGDVYRVKKGGEYFALKETDDKELRDREEKFLSLAEHPLFPKLAGSFDDGRYCLLEEYIWGTPLNECIEYRNGLAQPEAMRYAISVADGIAFLQQADGNILFRDLKAENLIVQPDGEIRLVDLGAAAFLRDADMSIAGTKGASAPEQFGGDTPQGLYSDVYAFGRLMYHMLTGKRAPKDRYDLSVRSEDLSFSACLELTIRRCTAKDPAQRIPDMYSVLTELVETATCTPAEYKKAEKNALRMLAEMQGGAVVIHSRNVQD